MSEYIAIEISTEVSNLHYCFILIFKSKSTEKKQKQIKKGQKTSMGICPKKVYKKPADI